MKTINYHIKAFQIAGEMLLKGKYLYYFIPGLVITILYWYFYSMGASFNDRLYIVDEIPLIGGFLSGLLDFLLSGFEFIFNQIYIFVVLTMLSPFNTSLSEKIDNELTGNKMKSGFVRFINEFIRMIFVVILALTLELIFLIFYWIISWILPDLIDEIIYFTIAAFFFGFSLFDFSLERDEVGVFGSLGFAFSNPLTMFVTGGLFQIIYMIPYLGIPLSPVFSVMIATVVYLYIKGRIPDLKQQNPELSTVETSEQNG